ncbi:hypothetical protein, partial [Streptomyces violascens]|uniref:hypothetical protein n=1 Tax=Streptomyces violascens TaxID=67381 RepID=UPI0036563BAA
DFWHAVEFSRNGRFLRTHPLGLSSGRFPSVFCVPSLADPISRFCHPLERAADSDIRFRVSLFGDSDSIRSFSADRIGFVDFEW